MPPLSAILAEYGVEIVPNRTVRRPRQTHAEQTLARILRERGPDHLRDVLASILESENNALGLTAPIIIAVSGLLAAHGEWFEADASRWLAVFDRIDLVGMHEAAKRNRKAASPVSAGVATLIYRHLAEAFGPARPDELPLFDRVSA